MTRIAFLGTPEVAVPVLETLANIAQIAQVARDGKDGLRPDSPWGPMFAELAENVGTSTPMRPTPLTQDQLLGLFASDVVGRNVVLEPATQFDMCGRKETVKQSLEVVYDEV